MPPALDPSLRVQALALLAEGKSVRQAAAMLGVGKSTVEDWKRNFAIEVGLRPATDTANSTPPPSQTNSARHHIGRVQDATGSKYESSGTGIERGEPARVSALGQGGPADQPSGPADTEAHDRLPPHQGPMIDRTHLEAMRRYLHMIANGVSHHHAVTNAQHIDPDFSIDESEYAWIMQRIANHARSAADTAVKDADERVLQLKMAEDGIPSDLATDRKMDEAGLAILAASLFAMAKDAYLAALNRQLSKLGLPLATALGPDLLQSISAHCYEIAKGIASTYNRNLDSVMAALLLTSDAGDDIRAQLDAWVRDRAMRKAEEISTTEAGRWFNQGVVDFVTRNPSLVASIYVRPHECVCDGCQWLVDNSPYTPVEASMIPLPLHPRCPHELEVDYVTLPVATALGLWRGQDAEDLQWPPS